MAFLFFLLTQNEAKLFPHTTAALHTMPFSNYVNMCTNSLVPRPQITALGLGMRLPHTISASRSSQSLPGPAGQRKICTTIEYTQDTADYYIMHGPM